MGEHTQTSDAGSGAKAYGLVLENTRTKQVAFLSARIAQRVVSGAAVSPIPNSQLGMALIGGQVIPVVSLGDASSELIVCELWESVTTGIEPAPASGPTETVAVGGVKVLASGAFKRLDAAHIEFRGESVEALELAHLIDALE